MVLRKLFGEKKEPAAFRLPEVGEATLGRAVRIDPSMLSAMETALGEPISPELVITGQGVIEMADDQGASWLHRFYDDDDRMLQAVTSSPEGGIPEEWSFYVPAGSEHLAVGQSARDWTERLSRSTLDREGERFERLWYEGDDRAQPPVRLVETVYEEEAEGAGRELVQDCMVYGRETAQGELLLLALVLGEGREATFEWMLGTGLRPHQVTI